LIGRPHDEHYRHIYAADKKTPLILYYRGRLSDPDIPVVGVIGSRSCTSYGCLVTKAAVSELVQKKNIIASGLSFGIDALAHKTTLKCQGVTYAFVPCGLHKAQPASHAALMEKLADTTAVITAYAFGKEALPFLFIRPFHWEELRTRLLVRYPSCHRGTLQEWKPEHCPKCFAKGKTRACCP